MKNFHKESSGIFGASSGRKLCHDRRLLRILGLSLVGSGPCAHGSPGTRPKRNPPPTGEAGELEPDVHRGLPAQDGVNSGPPFKPLPEGSIQTTVSNLDTSLGRGSAEECACC